MNLKIFIVIIIKLEAGSGTSINYRVATRFQIRNLCQ